MSNAHVDGVNGPAVLVSGAGFAGLATAWWLDRLGYRVTVVERAPGLRRGGTPVDLEGEVLEVLGRMGLADTVRARALPPRRFEFKDAENRTLGAMPAPPAGAQSRYEIHRDDLLDLLWAALGNRVTVRFGGSIAALDNGPDAVRVRFDDGTTARYALVFGADGNRSRTRRLAFGDDREYVHFMGGHFLIGVVPETGWLPADVSQVYSAPGRTALLNGYADRTDLALAFRSPDELADDRRDRAVRHRLVRERFADLGWQVPRMLDRLDAADDVYFDRLNQIRMPAWSTGRVVLVGDAGYCVSPVAGMGGSVALLGAARLADALARYGDDHRAAFAAYHAGLRGFVDEVQARAAGDGMATMFPADEAELAARDRRLAAGGLEL